MCSDFDGDVSDISDSDIETNTVETDDIDIELGSDVDIELEDDVDIELDSDVGIELEDDVDIELDGDVGIELEEDADIELDGDVNIELEDGVEIELEDDSEEPEELEKDPEYVIKRDEADLLREGNEAINRRLEAVVDNYIDQGLSREEIDDRLAADRWNFQKEFLEDAFQGQDISPNVFNGFAEYTSEDRLRDIEQSSSLQDVLGLDSQSDDNTEFSADETEPEISSDGIDTENPTEIDNIDLADRQPDDFTDLDASPLGTETDNNEYLDDDDVRAIFNSDEISDLTQESTDQTNDLEEDETLLDNSLFNAELPEEWLSEDVQQKQEENTPGYFDDAVPDEFREFGTNVEETKEAAPGYYNDAVPDEFHNLFGAVSEASETKDIDPDIDDGTTFSAEVPELTNDGNKSVDTSFNVAGDLPSPPGGPGGPPPGGPSDVPPTPPIPPDDIPTDKQIEEKKRDEFDLLKTGNYIINRRLEAIEDDYKDKGLSDEDIRDRLAADRWNIQKEYLNDAFPGQDVSPNVFNGFSENGSQDRLNDLKQSEKLQEAIARESYDKRIEEDDYILLNENDIAPPLAAGEITSATEPLNDETDRTDKTEPTQTETAHLEGTAIINDDDSDDIDGLQPTETENDEESSFELTLNDIDERYKSAAEAKDTQEMEKYRTLHELLTLQDELELTDGDPDIPQLGGIHKNVRGKIKGFESHHIPAQSVQDVNANRLPTIAITEEDHRLTDSYRGKSNRKYKPFLPDGNDAVMNYKHEAEGLIEDGNYVDLVRDEVFNIRDRFGHKYDGAIKQYLSAMAKMIDEKGVPKKK